MEVTEDWIRERVGLKHNNLEDVRSLSLPGTYHEKISTIGNSMKKFTRLKSLDLSRNAIESLAGLETMKLLEKLNLYYNGIDNLQELYRLRYNSKLQDLDLRLNPVARNEPDYRLFVIHMLPSLRRLDDRSVRDSERKAALMHFGTDQAHELTYHSKHLQKEKAATNPRADHVKTLAKTAVDIDDAYVLEYMNPNRGEMTGSAEKFPSVEDYNPESLRAMNKAGIGIENAKVGIWSEQMQQSALENVQGPEIHIQPPSLPNVNTSEDENLREFHEKYPNLALINCRVDEEKNSGGNETVMPSSKQQKKSTDPNLNHLDDLDVYTSYKAEGQFTPNPDNDQKQEQSIVAHAPNSQRCVELYTAEDLEKDLIKLGTQSTGNQKRQSGAVEEQTGVQYPSSKTNDRLTGDVGEFTQKLSSLVDKYWNGSKSLLKNIRFKAQLAMMLKEYRKANNDEQSISSVASTNASLEFEITRLKHSMDKVVKENEDLKEKLFQISKFENLGEIDESTMKQSYMKSQRDVKILRDRLQKSIEENKHLQNQLAGTDSQKEGVKKHFTATDMEDIAKLQKENNALHQQIQSFNIKVKQFDQMQELAAMLQQSHKSLVQSNDHLLKEMEEAKQRYKQEIQQLTWSLNEYKRSAAPANNTFPFSG